ncbi:MAG: hypothetical protein ACSHX6_04860 [Akkermansiaceae bacterium]
MSKKEPRTIEAEVEVVSSTKTKKPKPSNPSPNNQQAENPFAGMGGMGAGMDGMPDLSAMFGKNGMPDLSKIPGLSLRQRLTFKVVGLLSNPKLRFLKSKWSIPLWGIIAIVVLTVILAFGLLFLTYKLLKAILTPYLNIFRKKSIE